MPTQLRSTRQREAIRAAFLNADRPLSPEEALHYAQERMASVSVATMYRNIHALVAENWLVPVEIPSSSPRYEVAGKEHHHHFQCTTCGKTFELDGCALQLDPKLPDGFMATHHEFFLYGRCASCPTAAN